MLKGLRKNAVLAVVGALVCSIVAPTHLVSAAYNAYILEKEVQERCFGDSWFSHVFDDVNTQGAAFADDGKPLLPLAVTGGADVTINAAEWADLDAAVSFPTFCPMIYVEKGSRLTFNVADKVSNRGRILYLEYVLNAGEFNLNIENSGLTGDQWEYGLSEPSIINHGLVNINGGFGDGDGGQEYFISDGNYITGYSVDVGLNAECNMEGQIGEYDPAYNNEFPVMNINGNNLFFGGLVASIGNGEVNVSNVKPYKGVMVNMNHLNLDKVDFMEGGGDWFFVGRKGDDRYETLVFNMKVDKELSTAPWANKYQLDAEVVVNGGNYNTSMFAGRADDSYMSEAHGIGFLNSVATGILKDTDIALGEGTYKLRGGTYNWLPADSYIGAGYAAEAIEGADRYRVVPVALPEADTDTEETIKNPATSDFSADALKFSGVLAPVLVLGLAVLAKRRG